MMKQLLFYFLAFAISMFLGHYIQTHFLDFSDPFIEFLTASYIFLSGFTILLCFGLFLVHKKKQFQNRLGFFYLFSVGFKIILYGAFFEKQIFGESFDSNKELFNLLIIIVLTLIFEVLFISRLLNNSDEIKNVE